MYLITLTKDERFIQQGLYTKIEVNTNPLIFVFNTKSKDEAIEMFKNKYKINEREDDDEYEDDEDDDKYLVKEYFEKSEVGKWYNYYETWECSRDIKIDIKKLIENEPIKMEKMEFNWNSCAH